MENDELFLNVIEYTNQSMFYELFTDPSFGLVSPYSTGAHSDMNSFTFINSASVLNKYMYQFAKLSYSDIALEELYEQAKQIGIACEAEMFVKTKGVNTHKGLIFVLGTLICGAMKALYNGEEFAELFNYCHLITKEKRNELYQLNDYKQAIYTHGETVYLQYQVEGARKEAYMGFPIIQTALPLVDIDDETSLVKTLIYIMSQCEDTTIIHRLGPQALEDVQMKMKNLIASRYNPKLLLDLNNEFIQRNISPGGSADLLCGTVFVSLIKKEFKTRRESK